MPNKESLQINKPPQRKGKAMTSDTELRPEETWTISYVRKMIRQGRIDKDQAISFVGAWNKGVPMRDRVDIDNLYTKGQSDDERSGDDQKSF
jgi:hypothetical protein